MVYFLQYTYYGLEKKVLKIQMQKRKGNKNSENLQQKILYYEVKKISTSVNLKRENFCDLKRKHFIKNINLYISSPVM